MNEVFPISLFHFPLSVSGKRRAAPSGSGSDLEGPVGAVEGQSTDRGGFSGAARKKARRWPATLATRAAKQTTLPGAGSGVGGAAARSALVPFTVKGGRHWVDPRSRHPLQ